jgi:hypothetical protein
MNEKVVYPWPTEIYEYLQELNASQYVNGKCKKNPYGASGMHSFSFWIEGLLYDAVDDSLLMYKYSL